MLLEGLMTDPGEFSRLSWFISFVVIMLSTAF